MSREPAIKADLSASNIGPATTHWDHIDDLRERHRYFWNQDGSGYWVLTRYDDIKEAFQSPETFSNASIIPTDPEPDYRFLPSHLDAPLHMKYRRLMNAWFAPKAVERYTPHLEQLARELISEVAPNGSCDYTLDFGDRFPVSAFLLSVGLPIDDGPKLVAHARDRQAAKAVDGDDEQGLSGWQGMRAHWAGVLEQRRREPLDPAVDFVTHLAGSTIDDVPLTDDEIVDTMSTLTVGSIDTLGSQLGWCMYHLATTPDDRGRLVADPSLVPSAVEEFLRAYPVVSMARKVVDDVDFHGCPMRKGDMVLLSQQAATRDPRVFPDADKVILDRSPNRHVAFGMSAHRCVGSHLARAELRIAIEQWHRQIPEYHLVGERPLAHGGQIALLDLPLAWEAA
jgi:cytochrome P450